MPNGDMSVSSIPLCDARSGTHSKRCTLVINPSIRQVSSSNSVETVAHETVAHSFDEVKYASLVEKMQSIGFKRGQKQSQADAQALIDRTNSDALSHIEKLNLQHKAQLDKLNAQIRDLRDNEVTDNKQ